MTTFINTRMILLCQPCLQLLFHSKSSMIASDNNFHSPKVQFLLSTFLFFGLLIAVENLAKVYSLSTQTYLLRDFLFLNQNYFLIFVHKHFMFSALLSTHTRQHYFSTTRKYVQLFITYLGDMNISTLMHVKLVNKPTPFVNYEFYKLHLNFLPTI